MGRIVESSFKFKFTIVAITSIVVPKTINIISSIITKHIVNPIYSYLIFAAILLFFAFCVEVLKWISKTYYKEKLLDIAEGINNIGSKYRFYDYTRNGSETKLFYIDNEEMSLLEALLKKRYKVTIYYSLSLKNYISWIDLCYFSFLYDLSNELKCKVSIAIHPDKNSRLIDEEGNNEELSRKYERYKKEILKIIPKANIVYEEEIYKNYSKNFSTNFHSFYVSELLQYANKLSKSKTIKNKTELLNTHLGYLESVYIVQTYARKHTKKSQVFVLDRKNSQEIWNGRDELKNFKSQNHIVFIGAATIYNVDKIKYNVYDGKKIINVLDNKDDLLSKGIDNLSVKDLKNIYALLRICLHLEKGGEEKILSKSANICEDNMIDEIANLLKSIRDKYGFGEVIG